MYICLGICCKQLLCLCVSRVVVSAVIAPSGNTARDLAIYCDFYDCADLIDELQKLQMKQLEDQRQSEKIKGTDICNSFST